MRRDCRGCCKASYAAACRRKFDLHVHPSSWRMWWQVQHTWSFSPSLSLAGDDERKLISREDLKISVEPRASRLVQYGIGFKRCREKREGPIKIWRRFRGRRSERVSGRATSFLLLLFFAKRVSCPSPFRFAFSDKSPNHQIAKTHPLFSLGLFSPLSHLKERTRLRESLFLCLFVEIWRDWIFLFCPMWSHVCRFVLEFKCKFSRIYVQVSSLATHPRCWFFDNVSVLQGATLEFVGFVSGASVLQKNLQHGCVADFSATRKTSSRVPGEIRRY